jgi:outer membrane lipoprotein-sorting protein
VIRERGAPDTTHNDDAETPPAEPGGKESYHMKRYMTMRTAAAVLAIFVLAQALYAAPDFAAMLKEVDEMGNFGSLDLSVTYTVVDTKPNKPDSVYQWSFFRRDYRDQIVMVFLKPEAQRGQGILKVEDDVFMWEPDVGWTHTSMSRNIENSNAKTSDFRGSSLAKDYEVKSAVESTLGRYPVWVLTLKARTDEVSYDWLRLYIRKDKPIVLKQENYSVADSFERATLLRTILVPPKYVEVAGKTIPVETRIVDEVNKGSNTVLSISQDPKTGKYLISAGKLPDSTFSKAFLEQAHRR